MAIFDKNTFLNMQADIDQIGEAINEKKIVTPRIGGAFKSIPLVVEEAEQHITHTLQTLNFEAEAAIVDVINHNMTRGFSTETILREWKPDFNGARAKADDTKKIWRWELTSAVGVTPIIGNWLDTGLSDLDLANKYADKSIVEVINKVVTIKNENLFLSAKKIQARYINTAGNVAINNTTEMVVLEVEEGGIYSIQSPNYKSDAFYAAYGISDNPVAGQGPVVFTDSQTQLGVKQFTVPSGVSYIYLNTLLPNYSFDIRTGVILNTGNTIADATVLKIKDAKISDPDALHKTDVSGIFQLYDPLNNISNKFVRYNTGNIETSASATVMNIFPVDAGEIYSIDSPNYANFAFAIAFRNSASVDDGATISVATLDGNDNLRKFTAPSGATHAFINVVIPSVGFDISSTVKINKGTSIVEKSSIAKIKGMYLVDTELREIVKKLLEAENVTLRGKKWLAIGDSITHKNDRSRFNYHYYLSQEVGGMTVYNYGISGSGFFNRYNVSDSITQADVDLITVFLGTNDWGNQTSANQKQLGVFGDTGTTTTSGCINTLLTGLINKFPLIPIAIFTPLPRSTNYGLNAPNNAYGYNLKDVVDLLHEYATHYSLPILDLYSISNLYPWLPASNEYYFKPFEGSSYGTTPDGLHPNDAGHQLLARKIRLFVESL